MLTKLYGYLAGVGALIVAVLAAWGIAKRSGAKQEQAVETEKALEQSKESNEIDAKVRAMSQPDLDKRLRDAQRD